MRGLIFKDFINMKKQMKTYIMLIVLWAIISVFSESGDFFSGVLLMIPALAVTAAMAYDDRYKWNGYALTMPVTRKDLVASKYVLSFIFITVTAMVSLIWQLVMGEGISGSLESSAIIAAVAMLINGTAIPIFFYFGSEHGRIVFFAAAVIIAAVVIGISSMGIIEEVVMADGSVKHYHVPTAGEISLLALACAAVVTALSVFVSLRIYGSKEF